MFSSVTSANLNQNQITDDANFDFSTQRKNKEDEKAFKELNKDDDSDQDKRSNSICAESDLSGNCDAYNTNGGMDNIFSNDPNSQDNVKVCIRVRPLNSREQQSQQGRAKCVQVD